MNKSNDLLAPKTAAAYAMYVDDWITEIATNPGLVTGHYLDYATSGNVPESAMAPVRNALKQLASEGRVHRHQDGTAAYWFPSEAACTRCNPSADSAEDEENIWPRPLDYSGVARRLTRPSANFYLHHVAEMGMWMQEKCSKSVLVKVLQGACVLDSDEAVTNCIDSAVTTGIIHKHGTSFYPDAFCMLAPDTMCAGTDPEVPEWWEALIK